MISFLRSTPKGSRIKSIQIENSKFQPHASAVSFGGKISGLASFLTIETDVGKERGIVRLLHDHQDGEKWKAFTLFTAMHELRGHEETIRKNRPLGVTHGKTRGRKNWQERRTAMENFDDGNEPTVLVLGTTKNGRVKEQNNSIDILLRGRPGWFNICSSSPPIQNSNLDHRPQSSRWRQPAK